MFQNIVYTSISQNTPFLLYIGLGPNIVLFFFYFLYLFLQYIQYIFPTLGLLVYSPIRRLKVPLQFIQVYLNILYNIRVIFLLCPLYYSGFNIQLQGGNISFLLEQCYSRLLISAYYTLEAYYLDLLEQFKERFRGAFLRFSNGLNTRPICYSQPDNCYIQQA